MEEEALGALSATTRLAAAAGLTAAAVQVAASSAQAAQLVPGDGDAISWRNYVAGFQGWGTGGISDGWEDVIFWDLIG